MEEVPCCTSRAPLASPYLCLSKERTGSKGAFRLPGAAGDHFHCTVEPSPGHIRCRSSAISIIFPEDSHGLSIQGAVKGLDLKGASCAKQTCLQRNGLPSAVVTRHPVGLGKSVQMQPGLSSRKSHLQVQMPQGRSLASASGTGQAIDLCFERSPCK